MKQCQPGFLILAYNHFQHGGNLKSVDVASVVTFFLNAHPQEERKACHLDIAAARSSVKQPSLLVGFVRSPVVFPL